MNIFILKKYYMTMYKQCDNVKEVARSDEPPENYQVILQLPSALRSFIVSFGLLFQLSGHDVLDHTHCSRSAMVSKGLNFLFKKSKSKVS